jgi:hypothetical protein
LPKLRSRAVAAEGVLAAENTQARGKERDGGDLQAREFAPRLGS